MSEILLRVELHDPEQAHRAIAQRVWPFTKEHTSQGRALVADIRYLDDAITHAQRGYLHAVVLTEIAAYARVGGRQYDMLTWKEHFRSEFLGFTVLTCINPFTGRKTRRRVRKSTEDLGVRGMANYIDRVCAFAATELGVTVSEPLPPELRPGRRKQRETVDAETGEIGVAA